MHALFATLMFTSAFIDLQPAPQSAFLQERRVFTLESDLVVVVDDHASQEDLAPLEPLFEALGFRLRIAPASTFNVGRQALYAGVVGKNAAFEHRSLRRYVPDPVKTGPEGYYLHIFRNGIVVAGTDHQGMARGLQTLAQLVRESRRLQLEHRGRPAIPQAEIRDHPDVALRAAYVRGPLMRPQMDAFAALKCNMLIFESDDFYAMNAERLALWQPIFRDARRAGITPVPVFEFFNVPDILLNKRPAAVEGRSRIDRLTLPAEDWVSLTRRHILLTEENPLRLTIGNTALRFRQDYLVSEGSLEAPFGELYAHPWMVRRIPGGAVPRDTAVEVLYSYAPPGSNALCPNASETRMLLRDALGALIDGLSPAYIHCGFGDISRLNQDLRCRATGRSNAEQFAEALALMHGIIKDAKKDVDLILWADALLPPPPGTRDDTLSLHSALEKVPGNPLLVSRFDAHAFAPGGQAEAAMNWMARNNMRVITAARGSAPRLYTAVQRLEPFRDHRPGFIVLNADPHDEATQAVFEKAWSLEDPVFLWPELLNAFFETDLWRPTFEEMREAVLEYIERKTLSGVSPKALREQLEQHVGGIRRFTTEKQEELRSISAFVDLVTRYMELEYEFSSDEKRTTLRDLENLVQRYGETDITVAPDRISRIQSTINEQGRFVPSSILFERPLAYYRPFQMPGDAIPCEAPARLEFADDTGSAQATLDFLVECGPLFRIDFETVDSRSVSLYGSNDGASWERIETRTPTTDATGAIRGPLVLSSAVSARFLRLQVESRGEQAVLREVRAFILRQPARARCPQVPDVNDLSARSDSGRHVGMLYADPFRLATAPTEIRLARDARFLGIAITARDPLPHAMSAALTEPDAPLWQEESIEICITPPNRPARRFLVNPLGTQYDAMAVASNLPDWDPGWDGDWQARAARDDMGWSAFVRIPFALLGGAPQQGESWQINFLRHRKNVEQETSAWALDSGNQAAAYGILVMD